MPFAPAGYFPKRLFDDAELRARLGVDVVASVSTCLSAGPERWIEAWRHNALGFFDTPEDARSVVDPEEPGPFVIHAYRILETAWRDGGEIPAEIPPTDPTPIPSDWVCLGYDAVGRDRSGFFGCSPLSCNYGAPELDANAFCLFRTAEAARAGAELFSRGGWEPGDYYVVEVWAAGVSR